MKISSLVSKLNKGLIPYDIKDINSYNKDIRFTISGRVIGYDNVNQETERRFFDNFKQLLDYAKERAI